MKQQIDFQSSSPRTLIQLPAKWITYIIIATFVVLTLISLGMALNQVRDNQVVKRIHAENIKVTNVFQISARNYPLLASEVPLAKQLADLENELQTKKSHHATLTRATLQYGFSNYLRTLAKVVPPGLWLNEIKIDQETRNTSMSGYMQKPDSVSQLLQVLQQAGSFKGTNFNLFYLKNIPEKSYAKFMIANTTVCNDSIVQDALTCK
ncbi:MAG: hypothetical protein A3F46_00215 [Legionellales bacterium RIFCSPHIGHO2_12_FULL_42_9]|nr:MAG: hypothetical protein A3F46_00215 [Legionellales bacterium RIFCSPHIGHO2_12_FULL_42_9]